MNRTVTNSVLALAMVVPLTASAGDCPPGAWFCEDAQVAPPPEAPQAPAVPPPVAPPAPQPRPELIPARPRVAPQLPPPGHGQPPMVVYSAPYGPPAQVVVVSGAAVAPRYYPPPAPPPPAVWARKWGLNMRVEGAMLGDEHKQGGSEGMGGFGLSLRYRPVPHFAFDLGMDIIGGRDFANRTRTEVPISLSGMVYFNPRSHVQLYMLGGVHASQADLETNQYAAPTGRYVSDVSDIGGSSSTQHHSYLGWHGGLGLEFRVSRLIGLNLDVLGFVRSRTDKSGDYEFVDATTGQITNTSGGGLARGGLTFWW